MANREVKIDVAVDATKFEKGTKKAADATSTLEKELKKAGPVGNVFQNVISKLGLASLTTAEGVAGGLVAGIGLATVVAEKGIAQFVALADKVREYSQVTGQSAEESSRQVEAFAELGVSADTAEAAMFKLARTVADTPKHLKAVGIEAALDSKGNVDLNGTLLNVVKAYQATSDASQRAAIVFAAFGKAGAAMIPILETNVGELKTLEDRVNKVLTEEDLERARKYTIQQNMLAQSWDNLGVSIGQAVIGPVTDAVSSLNENIYVNEHLDAKMKELYGDTVPRSRVAIESASVALHKEYVESQNAQVGLAGLNEKQKEAAAAAQAAADELVKEEGAEQKLVDSIHASIDANFAYRQAQLDLKDAIKAVRDAKGKDAEANLKLRESYVKVADAAVALAVKQAEANGTSLNAEQQTDLWRAAMEKLIHTLAPNSPLRKELQGLINELNSIPTAKTIRITTSIVGHKGGTAPGYSFDEGGVVPGPAGAPVPAIVHGGEMVLTPEQQRAASGHGGGVVVNVTVAGLVNGSATQLASELAKLLTSHGPAMDQIGNGLLRRSRSASGR